MTDRERLLEWQPIETAPKDVDVLVVTNGLGARDGRRFTVARYRDGWGWVTMPGRYSITASHWMPLPDPPKDTP